MPVLLESVIGPPLDTALVHTPCTACRARLHRLRMMLEQAEALPVTLERRPITVEKVELAVSKALRRLEAHVHVCVEALGAI